MRALFYLNIARSIARLVFYYWLTINLLTAAVLFGNEECLWIKLMVNIFNGFYILHEKFSII